MFFLPLPEPLPFPHGEIFTFIGDKHPQLEGVRMQQTREMSALPEGSEGRLFTSLRVWQRLVEPDADLKRMTHVVDGIVRSIIPADAYAAFRRRSAAENEEPQDADEDGLRDELRELGMTEDDVEAFIEEGPPSDYQTIVEAVTPLVEVDGPADPVSAAFDRCVDRLAELASAYRRAAHQPTAPITRERLPFTIYYLTYEIGEPKEKWSHGMFLAHMSALELLVLPPATPEQVQDIKSHLAASLSHHPLAPYIDRVIDAEHALRLGDTATAVILGQVAAEILLDALLGLLLWDEGELPEAVAEQIFASDLTLRVRRFYASRLGGDWNQTGAGPVGDWKREIYELRGRVIHGGYEPLREEARQAMASLAGLEEFCKTRLLEQRNRFPKTALVVLGPDGLERRGGWTRTIRDFAEQHRDNAWLQDYKEWRAQVSAARGAQ